MNSDCWDPVIQLKHKSTLPLFSHYIKNETEVKLNCSLFGNLFCLHCLGQLSKVVIFYFFFLMSRPITFRRVNTHGKWQWKTDLIFREGEKIKNNLKLLLLISQVDNSPKYSYLFLACWYHSVTMILLPYLLFSGFYFKELIKINVVSLPNGVYFGYEIRNVNLQ